MYDLETKILNLLKHDAFELVRDISCVGINCTFNPRAKCRITGNSLFLQKSTKLTFNVRYPYDYDELDVFMYHYVTLHFYFTPKKYLIWSLQ